MKDKIIAFFESGDWLTTLEPIAINFAVALAIFIIGGWVVSQIMRVIDKMMNLRKIDEALQGFLQAIIRTVFKFVVLLIAVEQLGIDTTSLLALLGAAGLAVGLALKDSDRKSVV